MAWSTGGRGVKSNTSVYWARTSVPPPSSKLPPMPQMNWTYVADSGQQYRVNLYHGNRSGHVLVTVNNSISVIDFFVRSDKSYTLMLEDEVFLLEIEKGEKGFSYGLTMDTLTKTDKNIRRQSAERRQNRWIAGIAIATVAVLLLFLLWFRTYQDEKLRMRSLPYLHEIGIKTLGRLGHDEGDTWVVHYTSRKQQFQVVVADIPAQVPELRAGDDFQVAFLPRKPQIAIVNWEHPGPRRSERLFATWRAKLPQPDNGEKALFWKCMLDVIKLDSLTLAQSQAPWQLREEVDFMQWLSRQSRLLPIMERQCAPENFRDIPPGG